MKGRGFKPRRQEREIMRLQPLRANVSIDHEQQLIRAFFVPAKRDRYIEMIASTRGRQKFLRELSHFKSLDPRYCFGLPNAVHTPGEIATFLNDKRRTTNVLGNFGRSRSGQARDGSRRGLEENCGLSNGNIPFLRPGEIGVL
ncbi:MAG: hypothetical protein ACLPHP_09350 [Candidatus Sulfotelmatobacter sp.]